MFEKVSVLLLDRQSKSSPVLISNDVQCVVQVIITLMYSDVCAPVRL